MLQHKSIRRRTVICGLAAMASSAAYAADAPVNPNLMPAARGVLQYIQSIEGQKVILGQQEALGNSTTESNYTKSVTGKLPAIRGFETAAYGKTNWTDVANAWKNNHQIITLTYHMGAPPLDDNTWDNRSKTSDITKVLTSGTTQNKSFMDRLNTTAARLKTLQDQGVPVLWRPFHECDGGWFWWSKEGPEQFKKLWRFEYDYFVNVKKLNNLIWVWNGSFEPDSKWYPGNDRVDITSTDTYYSTREYGKWKNQYNMFKAMAPTKPVALAECDHIPDPKEALAQGIKFTFYVTWHGQWLRENSSSWLKTVYSSAPAIHQGNMPDLRGTTPVAQNSLPLLCARTNAWASFVCDPAGRLIRAENGINLRSGRSAASGRYVSPRP